MTRRRFLKSMALASVGGMGLKLVGSPTIIAAAQPVGYKPLSTATSGARPFDTIGLYVAPPDKDEAHYYDFYQACGYNYLEFCEGGFARRPDLLPAYHKELAEAIAAAHKKGFKVWILLLAGMQQWKGPSESGSAGTFSALRT
jgi:hypothetical protein